MKLRLSIKILVCALSGIQLMSCKKQNLSANINLPKIENTCSACVVEEAYPNELGKEVAFGFMGEEVKVSQKGDKYILGGDIILSAKQVELLRGNKNENARTAVNSITSLWPNRTVFFTIDPALADQARVTNAIAHWQAMTNIIFTPRTTQTNYIEFTSIGGCFSNVGMVGGRQQISLGADCSTGNAIHEIGHAIGFFHEQTRSDRNAYITINFGNIIPGFENNFSTYSALGLGGLELQSGLDFNSIMLYGSFTFSKNSLATIVRTDGTTFTGQRIGLSAGDVDTYNYLYNRPFLVIVKSNIIDIDTNTEFGQTWDVYVKAYTNASKTAPMNLTSNLEVHYVVYNNFISSSVTYFTFPTGTNSYKLGKGKRIRSLVGNKSTSTVDFGLKDLIQ